MGSRGSGAGQDEPPDDKIDCRVLGELPMAEDPLGPLLDRYPQEVQGLALDARKFILRILPKVHETVDVAAGVAGYGYGTGYSDIVCTLIPSKSGVKLGLASGASLPDPEGLLAGRGRVHRYIQLHSPSDLSQPGLRTLIQQARKAWQRRTEGRHRTTR